MRALSVRVNEVIGVAGFVVPGTRVDVLATVRLEGQEGGMSKVVVSNVQVLTAGTRYDLERARTGEPMPSTVVTLMVTPEEAERIALAGNEGSLVLTLRNPLDTKPTETEGIRSAQLMGPAPKPPVIVQRRNTRVAVRPSAPEPPKTYTVEAIRAGQRGNEEVR
jgi:pilus assembly protein CpaB